MKRKKTTHEILVALDRSLISRTKKLCGIYRAAVEYGNISLRIMDDGRELTKKHVDDAVADGVNAFIVGVAGVTSALDRICGLSMPLATISIPYPQKRNVHSVHTDNDAIAKEAVRVLTGGSTPASYAYYPANENPEWSEERGKSFAGYVMKSTGHHAVILQRDGLAETLSSLPRPAALFAANDSYAVELMAACRKAGLSIPGDASVVGVDNEEFLCENASPSLTSIEPDFEQEGYLALTSVADILDGKHVPRTMTSRLRQTVIRRSTASGHYAESLVKRAMAIIQAEAVSGLNVSDICSRLKVSRRLLDMRFRQIKGTSPKEVITDTKLTALRKALGSSDEPIASVCRRCGFGSANHPKKLFRRRFGMTMREFRRNPCRS